MRCPFPYYHSDLRIMLLIGYLFFNQSAYFSPGNDWTMGIWTCTSVYLLTRLLLAWRPRLHAFLYFSLLLWAVCEAVYGILQLYGHYSSNNGLYRLTGSFLNPGPFSGFLAVIFPLALSCVLSPSGQNARLVRHTAGLCLFLTLSLLPAGMSRAAWVAAFAGSIAVFVHTYPNRIFCLKYYTRHRKKIIGWLCGLLSFLFAAGCGIYYLKKDSADGRLLIWKTTARIVAEHPVTGVGAGNFAGTYGKAQAAYFATGQGTPQEEWVAGSPEYGFNEFLQIAAEHGMVGLLLFLTAIVFAFRNARKNRQYGITGSLTAYLVFACFSYPFSVKQLIILFALLMSCANSRLSSAPAILQKRELLFTGLCLLAALFPLFRTGYHWQKRQEAIVTWKEEQTYYNMRIYEDTTENYRKLYPALKDEPAFLFEWGQCLAKTGAYEESNRILREGTRLSSDPMFWNISGKNHQSLGEYAEAESCFRHAAAMIPHRLYPVYLLAHLYFASGQIEKGIDAARTVISRKPKINSSAIEEMKAEMKEKLHTLALKKTQP